MPKYLISGSFSAEGLQRLQKEGRTPMFVDKASGRGQAFSEAVQALGGKVEALYFSLGEDDVYVIADLPDNSTAAAIVLAASATGRFRLRSTALLTPEEVDRAREKSAQLSPAGG
jgi:uncharacterized protein with GYD domain